MPENNKKLVNDTKKYVKENAALLKKYNLAMQFIIGVKEKPNFITRLAFAIVKRHGIRINTNFEYRK